MGRFQWILLLGMVLSVEGVGSASPVLDQSFDSSEGSSDLAISTGSYRAMTFTAGMSGWLSNVAMPIRKTEGTTGNVDFELRKTSGGVPLATPDGVLCTGTIPTADLPVYDTFPPSIPYTMLDLSATNTLVQSGEVYALCLHRIGSYPYWALWRCAGDEYAGGQSFFRSSSTEQWTGNSTWDFGFQTWVDPMAFHNMAIAPTFDVEARSPDGNNFTILEGLDDVEQYRSANTDRRGVIEFDISGIPDEAHIASATLTLDISCCSGSGDMYSEIDLHGYAGNGVPEPADALHISNIIGTTGPLQHPGVVEVTLDPDYIESLLGTAEYLGLVANARWDYFQSMFFTSERHAWFPSGVIEPTLNILYASEIIPGDANGDGQVDEADATLVAANWGKSNMSWADGEFNDDGRVDVADAAILAANWGHGVAAGDSSTPAPEPATAAMTLLILVGLVMVRPGRN